MRQCRRHKPRAARPSPHVLRSQTLTYRKTVKRPTPGPAPVGDDARRHACRLVRARGSGLPQERGQAATGALPTVRRRRADGFTPPLKGERRADRSRRRSRASREQTVHAAAHGRAAGLTVHAAAHGRAASGEKAYECSTQSPAPGQRSHRGERIARGFCVQRRERRVGGQRFSQPPPRLVVATSGLGAHPGVVEEARVA